MFEYQIRPLIFFEPEAARYTFGIPRSGLILSTKIPGKPKAHVLVVFPDKFSKVISHSCRLPIARIIQRRQALEIEIRRPLNHMRHAHYKLRLIPLRDRHEIKNLNLRFLRKKACQQHIRVRQVHLPRGVLIATRTQAEISATILVEQRSETRWRIELRQAKKIDR